MLLYGKLIESSGHPTRQLSRKIKQGTLPQNSSSAGYFRAGRKLNEKSCKHNVGYSENRK